MSWNRPELDILYEDEAVLVVRKPTGLAVQTAHLSQKDMVSIVKTYLAGKGAANPYVGIVHRLDQPVEGIMVIAKTPRAAAALSRQADYGDGQKLDGRRHKGQRQCRKMGKEYVAVVQLPPGAPRRGVLKDMLLRDGRTNTSSVVLEGTAGAKYSELEYEIRQAVQAGPILAESRGDENFSAEDKEPKGVRPDPMQMGLVSVHLKTGRHHQIRVQMAHAGMPLYGDQKYGGFCPRGANIALCAARLAFSHPVDGRRMEFVCMPQNPVFGYFRL